MDIKLKLFKKKNISKKWINWINNKETNTYSERKHSKHTIPSQKKWFDIQNKNGNLIFGIFYRNEHIGIIDIKLISKEHKNCEIGYFLGNKTNWKKGIGSKAVELVCDYIKKKLKLKKVVAHTYENNIASQKILIRNKFKKEGEIKNFYKFKKKRISKIYFGKNL